MPADGRLVFNPRFVIQNVLNNVLVNCDLFELRQFPPISFASSDRPLPAAVVQGLQRRVGARDIERYSVFFTYWAGFPSSVAEVEVVHSRLFQAFGLDKTRFGRDLPLPKRPDHPIGPTPTPAPDPRPDAVRNPLEARWQDILERWRAGVQLQQADARTLTSGSTPLGATWFGTGCCSVPGRTAISIWSSYYISRMPRGTSDG